MSMAAKDEVVANIERKLKEKVSDKYVQQYRIGLSSQYIAYWRGGGILKATRGVPAIAE